MQAEIEPIPLDFLGNPQTDNQIDHFQNDPGTDTGVDQGQENTLNLDQDLAGIAVDQTNRGITALDRLGGEHTGQDGTGDTADTVHAEDVQRIVIAEDVLDRGGGEEADHAGGDADDQGAGRIDEAG